MPTDPLKQFVFEFTYYTPQSGRMPIMARDEAEAIHLFKDQTQDSGAIATAIEEIGIVTLHDEPIRSEIASPAAIPSNVTPLPIKNKKKNKESDGET